MANSGYFSNRREAGRQLAEEVAKLELSNPIVLALPRGGVPVAYEIAQGVNAPLDILLVRKIGAPGHEEYGIGAVVDGASPQIVLDEAMARAAGADAEYIQRVLQRELEEIERRRAAYRTGPPETLAGRSVIVVDDGIATGGTVKAALQALQEVGAAKLVLAVPVAPADTIRALSALCDRIVCLAAPAPFYAVGAHYADFAQTEDAEVVELLAAAKRRRSPG